MPRYFFSIYDGRSEPDDQGMELPDLDAARGAALRFAGHVLGDEADSIGVGEEWRLVVTDATGRVVLRLDLRVLQNDGGA